MKNPDLHTELPEGHVDHVELSPDEVEMVRRYLLEEVEGAGDEFALAKAALYNAAVNAHEGGLPWAKIGSAVGITGSAANANWNRKERKRRREYTWLRNQIIKDPGD